MAESEARRRAVSATLLPGFVGTRLPEWLAVRLRAGLGGVCVFGTNIESPEQLRDLTTAILSANPLALIAIDEEGGDVTRLHYATGSPLPGNAILGRIGELAYTKATAKRIGWDLRRAGFNLNFAPDADINSNPQNPVIGVRSFGTSPADVAAEVAAWTKGLQATAVAACAKHFPGHGDTGQDSHLALPVVDRSLDQLRERELVPFIAAIAAGTKGIMSSHILLPQLDPDRPATLSRPILRGILREELGFDGLIVSDALDMAGASGTIGIPEAAVRALDAGCDLLCIGSDTTEHQLDEIERAVLHALEEGRLDDARVLDAAERVHRLADELASERRRMPVPATAGDFSEADVARVIGTFDIEPRVPDLLAANRLPLRVISLESDANNAIGEVPWGLAAELSADPARYEGTRLDASAGDGDGLVVVVGRDIHRQASARDSVDRLRASGVPLIVVEMGWPANDRSDTDIATFGASRLAGRALASYLLGQQA